MNVLDLFSGACGGWSLGLDQAGHETIAACEADEWRRRQFARNFPRARLYDDVRTLTAERLRADGIGPIDLVCGSPPCQDASTANTKGRGIDGERTGLYLQAVRLVLEIRPRWFAFENVPGIRNRGIDRVLGELEQGRYACWPLVVGAHDLRAPHIRKRSWVLGADAATVQRLALPWDQPDGDSERAVADRAGVGRGSRRAGRLGAGAAREQDKLDTSVADAMPAEPAGRGEDRGWQRRTEELEGTTGDTAMCGRCNKRQAGENGQKPTGGSVRGHSASRNVHGAGLEIGRGQRGDDGAQRASLERAIAERVGSIAQTWNGGIAGRLRMDDGLPKGMARPLLAAYGDAVVPQVAEIIGRAIRAAEETIRLAA